MVSNKQKGDKHEREFAELLNKMDYVVCRSPRTMKRIFTPKGPIYISQANDMFGLFDGIAVHETMNTVYYQVKSHSHSFYMKEIIDFHCKYFRDNVETWLVLKVPRTGWVVKIFDGKESHNEYYNLKGEVIAPFVYSGD